MSDLVGDPFPFIGKLLEKGLLALLIVTPLAFGGVQKWTVSLLETGAFLLLALLLLKQLLAGRPPASSGFPPVVARTIKILCLLFTGLILLQLLPLPQALLTRISPVSQQVYASMAGVSTDAWQTISLCRYATLQELLLLLAYAAVFTVIVSHYRSQAQIRHVITTILAMGGVLVLLAVLQKTFWNGRIFWIYPVDEYLAKGTGIWGPYINRNHFAGYLELAIPLALGMLLYLSPSSRSLPGTPLGLRLTRFISSPNITLLATCFLLLLTMTAAVFATLSRGGIIALAVAFALFVLMTRTRRSLARRTLLLSLLVFVLAVVVIFASWQTLEERFDELDTGHVGRLNAWTDSLGLVRDFPLLGSGLGTFETTFRRYQSKETRGIYDHAHNDYLELITDTGFSGFTLVATIAVLFFVTLYRRWRSRRNLYAKCLGAGGLASCSAIAAHGFSDFNLHIPANALLLTVIAGLTYAVLFNLRDERFAAGPAPTEYKSALTSRLGRMSGILALLALLCLPLSGFFADRHYAAVDSLLDDKKTVKLDTVELLPVTAPLYLAALGEDLDAHGLEPLRAMYCWNAAELATRLGRWISIMQQFKAPIPAGLPTSEQAFEIARSQLLLAVSAEPINPCFHLALADLYQSRYNDSDAAEVELRRALESWPANAAVRLAVARHHLAAGRSGDALEQLRLLAKLDDSYLLFDSSRKADILELRPSWYMNKLCRSNLFAALDLAWRITRDPLVVKGLAPENSEARIVLQAFLDAKGIE